MSRSIVILITLLIIPSVWWEGGEVSADSQKESFILVDGASLNSKFDKASNSAFSNSKRTRFWIAYSFNVRPGVGVDVTIAGSDGSGMHVGLMTGVMEPKYEARNVGLFLLYDSGIGSIIDAELFNLDLRTDYKGHPVYWLGQYGDEDSLNFLNRLIASKQNIAVAEALTDAIALHKDAKVEAILKNLAQHSPYPAVRAQAESWLKKI
jgi:hypothetical protein